MRWRAECTSCGWAFESGAEHRANDKADRHELENPTHRVEIDVTLND